MDEAQADVRQNEQFDEAHQAQDNTGGGQQDELTNQMMMAEQK